MKIGITCYPTYGGSGVLATELGKLLSRKGHEIHFITSSLPYRLQMSYEERIFFHEVESHAYPPFEHTLYNLALAAKMKEIFCMEKLDVLHVHYALPHAISAYLASKMLWPHVMPVVTTLHGTDITVVGQEKSFYDITRLGINESTVVTTVSNYLKEETLNVFKPTIDVRTIYNFVDTNLFQRSENNDKRACIAKPEQIIYIHISNFRKVKRIPDVIKTFYEAQKEVDAVLLMVGEGPHSTEARELVSELGISDKVRFVGKQEDVVTLLSFSDVLIFPSETESFGLAAIEAMACKVPVVASISGGIPEVVEHGKSGYLSKIGDIASLARDAITLGKDKALRIQMGESGRRRALEVFNTDSILAQYENAYTEAIALAKKKEQESGIIIPGNCK